MLVRLSTVLLIARLSVCGAEESKGCFEDILLCPDGRVVTRDPKNSCNFPPCSTATNNTTECSFEFLECPDGSLVQRDPSHDCRFYPCPTDADSSSSRSGSGSVGFPTYDDVVGDGDALAMEDTTSGSSDVGDQASGSLDWGSDAGEDPVGCMKDVFVCPGGFFVSRNRSLACMFDPCPMSPPCPSDVKFCFGDVVVGRNQSNDCKFDPCP